MYKILIADPLAEVGLEILRDSGAQVDLLADEDRPRLPELVASYDALVVRSMTKVTAEILAGGGRLKVVGRAGVGVDNVDVQAATEHTLALLLALARSVPAADASMKAGEWNRKRFVGVELDGKTLGVVGFGRIGQRVADRARAFGMEILAHDPFLDPERARRLDVELLELDPLLERSDVVTLHVPLSAETRDLISRARLERMRPGALLVNCARGGVVDEEALLEALEAGRLGGAGLDVYAEEPPEDFTLMRHPKVVATPHIGAQTREAQTRIASETARMVLAALDGSLAITAVNLPFRPAGTRGEPYLALGEHLGRLASRLLDGSARRLTVDLWGVDDELRTPVSVAVLKGCLATHSGEVVNYVNAAEIARSRGFEMVRSTHSQPADYPHLVGVALDGEGGRVELAGTLFGERDPRVVRFGDFPLEFRLEGKLLVLENRDVPGVVGKLGQTLGEASINIADLHLARRDGDETAVAVLRLDQNPSGEILERIAAMDEVQSVRMVDLE